MKFHLLDAPRIIMENPYSRLNYFAWPTFARLKNGKLAAAASGFRLTHVSPFGKSVLSFSDDEGASWSLPAPVIDTVLDDRDAGLLPFGESGVIVTSFNNTRKMQREWVLDRDFHHDADDWLKNATSDSAYRLAYLDMITDEQEAAELGGTFRVSFDNGTTFGPLHLAPISSPHGPTELNDGTILWVGEQRSDCEITPPAKEQILAYQLHPSTGNMTFIGSIPDIADTDGSPLASYEAHALQLPSGRILCHIRVQRRAGELMFTLYQTESDDGGKTWTAPHRLIHPQGGAPSHIMMHSSGVLIAAYSNRLIGKPGIRVMFSTDGGENWDTDHILYESDFGGDLGYPATVELNDGSLLTVFYAHTGEEGPAVIWQQRWALDTE